MIEGSGSEVGSIPLTNGSGSATLGSRNIKLLTATINHPSIQRNLRGGRRSSLNTEQALNTEGFFYAQNLDCILQCCGSGMFILNPDFFPSWIQQKKEREKFVVLPFFCSRKCHKIVKNRYTKNLSQMTKN
jgi:hypothetical protein